MKKFNRLLLVLLLAGIASLVSGIILGFNYVSAVAFLSDDASFIEQPDVVITTQITALDINMNNRNVKILKGSEDVVRVSYFSKKDEIWDIKAEGETLVINQENQKTFKFMNWIGAIPNDKQNVRVYLPEGVLSEIVVNNDTGKIVISDQTAKLINVKTETGNIEIDKSNAELVNATTRTGDVSALNLTVLNDINLKTSTGNIKINNSSAKNVDLQTRTGNAKVISVDVVNILKLKTNTGNVSAENSVCALLDASTSTGAVGIYNCSSDVFKASSSTGNISFRYDDIENMDLKLSVNTGTVKVNGSKKGRSYSVDNSEGVKLTAHTNTGNVTVYK